MARTLARAGTVAMVIALLTLAAACSAESAPPVAVTAPGPTVSPKPVATVQPTATPEPAAPGLCDAGSLIAIWAHYDDDLIFGHSRVAEALDAGWCVTIAYLSAGDAGRGVDYSRGREAGIREAYNTLRGYDGNWEESTDVLETGVTVEEWVPTTDPRLSLLSFRLVDGNINGNGFESMGFESLAKLAAGTIPTIRDVDGPQQLTLDDITHSLVEIIADAEPDAVLTGMPLEAGDLALGDHSDHSATASFARSAWRSLGIDAARVTHAIGYQTSEYPVNVEGEVLERKVAAFSAYALKDPITADCNDLNSCLNLPAFGAWLQREYAKNAAELNLH